MPVLKIMKNGNWVEVWGSTYAGGQAALKSSVTLYGDLWVGEEAPYSQSVVIKGVGVNSTVDLRPTPEQAIEFGMENIILQAINNDGDVVIYALDEKPTADYTIEARITDSIIL